MIEFQHCRRVTLSRRELRQPERFPDLGVFRGHAAGPSGAAVGAGAADPGVLAALTVGLKVALTASFSAGEGGVSRIGIDVDVNVNQKSIADG